MAQHLKLIALLIFTLSASYTSAQSLRKLLERPYGIIESKWEKDAQVDNPFKSASSYTFYRGRFQYSDSLCLTRKEQSKDSLENRSA